LSDRHAEIKFVDNSKYILQDCGSETGTWIRIGRQGDNKDASECGLDLY
jgi:pSer/pThr/pTyr-binding forkhead associated (FHA) protein